MPPAVWTIPNRAKASSADETAAVVRAPHLRSCGLTRHVPHLPRIEKLDRERRQDHAPGERCRRGFGAPVDQAVEVQYRYEACDGQGVHHRPTSDFRDYAVDP